MAKTDYRQYNNLITANEVVLKAMTNVNMDSSIIDDNIVLIAELTHLKPHLGDYFWGELRKKHHAGSLVTVETTLLNNYILPCLAFYVKYEVLNDMQYNTTSSGIVTNDDDWSDAADSSELATLKDDTFRKAEILLKDMMEWLDDTENVGVYPEYESSQNDMHINGDNVVRLGGILAYGSKMNRYTSIKKKDERYYN
mgnify:FL=1|tara:strand:+ start:305 stop:895 length:591 start_codon:yes stop_codon:yes gene_type:complete